VVAASSPEAKDHERYAEYHRVDTDDPHQFDHFLPLSSLPATTPVQRTERNGSTETARGKQEGPRIFA
jgi:hypothetical protein